MLVLALVGVAGMIAPVIDGPKFAQLTIQQRVVIRIPLVPVQAMPQKPLRWVEKRGPKCVEASSMAGFVVRGPQMVDLFMKNGARIRTHLEKQCAGVDLGYGFYVKPNSDGQVCRDRDMLHARTGGQCEIEKFALLEPER